MGYHPRPSQHRSLQTCPSCSALLSCQRRRASEHYKHQQYQRRQRQRVSSTLPRSAPRPQTSHFLSFRLSSGQANYGTAKAGVTGLTKVIAKVLSPLSPSPHSPLVLTSFPARNGVPPSPSAPTPLPLATSSPA